MRLGDQLPMLMIIELPISRRGYRIEIRYRIGWGSAANEAFALGALYLEGARCYIWDLPIETHIVTFVALSTSAACSTATYAPAYAFVYALLVVMVPKPLPIAHSP
jgi:hypothetical protein